LFRFTHTLNVSGRWWPVRRRLVSTLSIPVAMLALGVSGVGMTMVGAPASSDSPPMREETPSTVRATPLSPAAEPLHRPMRSITTHRASANSEATLARRIAELVQTAGLEKGKVSISVRACDDGDGPGREIVAIDAARAMIPASNMKVVSTGAALHTLGPDFEFTTEVLKDGDVFTIVGDGDPAFGDPAFFGNLVFRDADNRQRNLDEEALLGFWADAIAAASDDEPIRLLVDDSIFEQVFWHEGWNPNDRLKRYAAEVTGLNFHRNTFHFRPDATLGGERPDWTDMRPRAGWLLDSSRNISTRGGPKDDSTAWISRLPESNDLTFRGVVQPGRLAANSDPLEVTFHDPPMVLADLLAERLQERGVEVISVGRVDHRPTADARSVGPIVRTPIQPIVERCNEESQNLYAESLLKRTIHARTGRPGSWADADDVIRDIATERLGDRADVLLDSVHISDGSGLSRNNRVTASFLTAWLDSFDDDPRLRHVFVESLSRGADPNDGTLAKRFRDLPDGCLVDGKSGYISGVSTLSGFVTAPDGRRWSFSVLCNDVAHNIRGAKSLQESVVRAVALHGLAS
jgi:D-alanyl-D-alanine carboxypeptidase/D-alanyl-D-alanine-endopeptidase (penicillin-binding protein 4)